jgi:hypothetical protein
MNDQHPFPDEARSAQPTFFVPFVPLCGNCHATRMESRSCTFTTTILAAITILVTAPAIGQGVANSALFFDGMNDLVLVPNRPLLELTDGTLELWFKPDWAPGSIAYDPVLIANRLGAALTRYSLHVDRNLAGIVLGNGSSVSTVAHAFTRGEWVHLALVESGFTAQVYVNGQFAGGTSIGFGTIIGLPLHLGSDGTSQFFRGEMDEVRIWSVARSATEIRYNLSRALAGNEPGLIAYWRLNEGIGTTAADATTNRFDGTLSGPGWINSDVTLVNTIGSLGMAVDLTANRSNFVQVASAPSLVLTNQLTFEAWVRPRTAQCNTILSRGDGTNVLSTDYIFQVGSDGTNCGVMMVALMVGGTWTISASTVPLNSWTHVAVTRDGATNRFYINGVLDRAVAAAGGLAQSSSPLFIGRQGTTGGNYFDGTLDEVRVWNTIRSATEIQTNLSRSLRPNEPGLVGYWRFNEQAGIQAFDTSGRSNQGTLMNRPLRVLSFWKPVLALNGSNPLPQECHLGFLDPNAAGSAECAAISAGWRHSLALRADGKMVRWGGWAQYTGLNFIANSSSIVAIATTSDGSTGLQADGTLLAWPQGFTSQTSAIGSNIVAIAAGGNHYLALRADGTILAWGVNDYGQTDNPLSATNVVAIAAGGQHSLALRADGTLVGWGRNNFGQTIIPSAAINVVAIAAGFSHTLALRADGTVLGWGNNEFGQITIPVNAANSVGIAAGSSHSLAVKRDGTVVGWGLNTSGQANIPPSASNVVAVAAGEAHSLALRYDGAVLGWGQNGDGESTPPGNLTNIDLVITSRSSVNPDSPGVYIVNYVTTNTSGAIATATRTVIVTDTTPPILTLIDANPLNLDVGTPFSDPGVTAADVCEGNVTASIVRSGTVNAAVPGSYTLTYNVTDSSGNTTTTNRTVLVQDLPAVLGFTAYFSGTNAATGSPVVQFLADVNPNGLATVAFAQYGLNTAYPGRTASVNLPAGYNTSTFFATLDGLVPGSTYHFRVAASNSLGVAYGPDQTFTVPTLLVAGDLNGDGRVNESELDNVLSNYWLTSTSLMMTNPSTLGGGLFQFALTNVSGWNMSVFASTNMTDWELLPAPARPVWQFLDPAYTNLPKRFYRLQWP